MLFLSDGFKLKRRNSLSNLIDEKRNDNKNGPDISVHRYHSPQMGRKSYVKPPKPKKPHGLKLEIPDKRLRPPIDSGFHSWSGTPPKSVSSTPSTANTALETPITATTPLSSNRTPKDEPVAFLDNDQHKEAKTKPIPARRQLVNTTPPLKDPAVQDGNHDLSKSRSTDREDSSVETKQKPKAKDRTKSLPRDIRYMHKLNTSRSLDDSVLADLAVRGVSGEDKITGEELTPKRKAPRPPHAKHVRRKSDTLMHVVNRPKPVITNNKHKRVTTAAGFSYLIKPPTDVYGMYSKRLTFF